MLPALALLMPFLAVGADNLARQLVRLRDARSSPPTDASNSSSSSISSKSTVVASEQRVRSMRRWLLLALCLPQIVGALLRVVLDASHFNCRNNSLFCNSRSVVCSQAALYFSRWHQRGALALMQQLVSPSSSSSPSSTLNLTSIDFLTPCHIGPLYARTHAAPRSLRLRSLNCAPPLNCKLTHTYTHIYIHEAITTNNT